VYRVRWKGRTEGGKKMIGIFRTTYHRLPCSEVVGKAAGGHDDEVNRGKERAWVAGREKGIDVGIT
jgi:hypothetical protein